MREDVGCVSCDQCGSTNDGPKKSKSKEAEADSTLLRPGSPGEKASNMK